jgi:hypothetical protein
MLNVCAVAVKFTPVTFAPFTVAFRLAGANVNPALLGVRVYVPFTNPVKVYAPALFAVVVALAAPLSVTVAPLPPFTGLIVPEMLNVGAVCGVAVKFTPVTFARLTVTFWLTGLNVNPVLLGVSVYVPLGNPVKVYAPALLVVVVTLAAPLSVTVAPAPPVVGLIVPEMLNVSAVPVKFTPVTFAPFTVAFWLTGANVYPAWLGVTVYVPFANPVNV